MRDDWEDAYEDYGTPGRPLVIAFVAAIVLLIVGASRLFG